jgi:DNA polymerase III delta prime subunit
MTEGWNMPNLQEVFNRIKETKRKAKEIKRMYKDELEASSEYREVLEKLEVLKARKKQIEIQTKEASSGEFAKLDAYKMHVKTDNELLSDLAFNSLVAGETVKVTDEAEQEYEPVFTVRFKKAHLVRKEN